MISDPYRNTAKGYDRLFDAMNKGLRIVGIRMFRPSKGMSILDVGCGTGSLLEMYQRYECHLYGLDLSPSMLAVARERLGNTAQLDQGNAADMPYEDGKFNLITSMLSLHEMSPETRLAALNEIKRVLKDDGRIVLIDFHTGPYQPLQGWISKLIIFLSEVAAGPEHFRNYRRYMNQGGLFSLAAQNNLKIEGKRILAGGTFVILLLSHESTN